MEELMVWNLQRAWSDVRYCLRGLGRNLDTTLASLLSLGLGVGLSSTLFTFVHAAFFAPLPVSDPGSLVAIYTKLERQSRLLPVSLPNAEDVASQASAFSGLAAYQSGQWRLGASPGAERVWGQLVSGEFFAVLGVKPVLGRMFLASEGRLSGRDPVVVLSHDLWQSRFAGDPGILGKAVSLNGHVMTVVGVAAEGFRGPSKLFACGLWVPLSMAGQLSPSADALQDRSWQAFRLVARLRPGVTVEMARQEVAQIGRRLERIYPAANERQGLVLVPFSESLLGMSQRALYVRAATLLSVLFLLVLLLSCANVANLSLSRVFERDREIALRLALGAGRRGVARLLFTESLIQALLAGLVASLIAGWAAPFLWSFRPPDIPESGLNLAPGPAVLAFTLGLSLLVSLLVWSVPLWQLRRRDLSLWLRDLSGRQSPSRQRSRLRSLLLVAQAAFAFVALAASMLLLLSFRRIGQIDPGFETRHLLVLACDLETDGLAESRGRQTYERLIEEVRRLPGVKAAALSENLIFRPARLVRRVTVDGADRPELADGLAMPTSSVSPGYFETLGSPLLSGRGFGHEQPGERRAAVVNQTFARMAWNTGDPLGRTLRLDGEAAPLTVIGVVRDARYESLTEAPAPHVFLSLNQFFSPSAALYVRTEGPINREIRDVAAPLARVVPEVSVTSIETARGLIEDSLWATRAGTCLLGGFAAVSLVLALLGIYCLTRRTVQQRRHEIGVRLALGADQRKVFWMIVGHSLRVTALGILIGAMAAIGCARALAGFLQDPALFGAIPLVLTGAALLTTAFVGGALPARTVMTFELREIFGMGG